MKAVVSNKRTSLVDVLDKHVGYFKYTNLLQEVKKQIYEVKEKTFTKGVPHRVPTPTLLSSTQVGKACGNNLNEKITPLLPTGIGERFSQAISNLGH